MKHVATFRFTGTGIPALYGALKPEIEDMGRSRVMLALEGGEALVLTVEADDISALRAALNTWLRLAIVAKEMQEVVQYG